MTRSKDAPLLEQVGSGEMEAGVGKLWEHFQELTQIPRKTGEEGGVRGYIVEWAGSRGFGCEIDETGNVLVTIPATAGNEAAPGIIFQGHMDMVCVGEPNPGIHGVKPKMSEDGKWVTAHETSLGADNGVGVAAILSLADENVDHGPLGLMFTVQEEVGIKGAMAMSLTNSLKDYRYFVNVDSEDEGEATISSAGGGDSVISLPTKRVPVRGELVTITLKDLMGGHSGVQIGQGRLNGIEVMAEVIKRLSFHLELNLVSLNGGDARNVIPNSVEAVIAMGPKEAGEVAHLVERIRRWVVAVAKHKEEQKLEIKTASYSGDETTMMTVADSQKVVDMLWNLPNGVIDWSETVPGLVETSTNLAVVKTQQNKVQIEMMTRSSVNKNLDTVRGDIKEIAEKFGGEVEESAPYPGWPADPESQVIQLTQAAWKKLTGEELKIITIHAGLECGVITSRYPHLEAISIGPTIKGAHSVEERVDIASVARFYDLLKGLVAEVVRTS